VLFDVGSAGTLVVEHLFSIMRQGNEMPLALEFAHKFSVAAKKLLKQLCQCGFQYYTHVKSYYQRGKIPVPYAAVPTMSSPNKNYLIPTSNSQAE